MDTRNPGVLELDGSGFRPRQNATAPPNHFEDSVIKKPGLRMRLCGAQLKHGRVRGLGLWVYTCAR